LKLNLNGRKNCSTFAVVVFFTSPNLKSFLHEVVNIYILKSSGGRRDPGVNLLNQNSDTVASSKKDMRFQRASSCGDADVSEASFMDMLKSNAKKAAPAEAHPAGFSETTDGTQGGRGGKKKGKKGRQIDPALLGFKVTSNRIMMGEIQRIDD
jgi:PERQ amino acid-rich with GYF domain-containing protein